jgi:hypothetical protein
VVLVSGVPGAGKSTIAGPLAVELGFALLAKDRIKEVLADALDAGAGDSGAPGTGALDLGPAALGPGRRAGEAPLADARGAPVLSEAPDSVITTVFPGKAGGKSVVIMTPGCRAP